MTVDSVLGEPAVRLAGMVVVVEDGNVDSVVGLVDRVVELSVDCPAVDGSVDGRVDAEDDTGGVGLVVVGVVDGRVVGRVEGLVVRSVELASGRGVNVTGMTGTSSVV